MQHHQAEPIPSPELENNEMDWLCNVTLTPKIFYFPSHHCVHMNFSLCTKNSVAVAWWKFQLLILLSWQEISCLIPFLTCSQKWWYCTLLYLVWGCNLGSVTSSRTPELSPNTLQYTWGSVLMTLKFCYLSSFKSCIIGMTWRKAINKAMYSASGI